MATTIKQYEFFSNGGLLAHSTKALWALIGLTFVAYVYCVGSITFSVVERQRLDHEVKELLSDISAEELSYLALDRSLTRQEAYALGLAESHEVSFSTRGTGFAFNADR
ncbi:MAG TPA: hypothetical protein VLB02_03110 [Candidatus Paceibacterota bacterium]|nr:hypothetical protein [Candidatus Paceibacterota bacterium]